MKKLILLLTSLMAIGVNAEGEVTKEVFISPGVVSIDITHQGEVVKLQRDQDRDNEISSFYVKTARGKIQKMHPFGTLVFLHCLHPHQTSNRNNLHNH